MSESSNYPGGWTLRFPRVEKIREDKPFDDCCTLSELQGLRSRKGVVQKLTKRHATAEDIWEVPEKKRKERHTTPAIKVDDCYLGINDSDVVRVSRVFMGKEFCVMNGERMQGEERGMTKGEIERLLMEHFGKIVQNPGKETFCVVAGDSQGIRVRNVVEGRLHDVVRVAWVTRATREENLGGIVEFFPWEMIGMTKKTLERLKERFDDYYDDYFEEADEERVRRSVERVSSLKDDDEVALTRRGVGRLEREMFGGTSPFGIFRGLVGVFVDERDVRTFEFRFMGGEVRGEVDEAVTDVFVGEGEVGIIELYGRINERGRADVRIVRSQWIEESFREGRILDRKGYTLT
ncbi:DNA ligase 4-like [Diachasma alloeum]|uniref:DNA ligase 4-like n=1 Tax=Diachasma alloeum TaxID=454923 RepID=UPI0010FB9D24|nr:DNA ligase 4-like [Diachasma alloeum]